MVDFALALSTVSQALKLANDLRGIEKAYDAAELKLKIAELTEKLADLKVTLIDAKDEIATKQAEIDRLGSLLKRHAELIEVDGYKYDKGSDGKAKGHAYCPVCEQSGSLIHVVTLLGEHQQCPKCKALYQQPVFR
jgi:DNA repair exonuclease SbcCD ATPase subunit